MVDTSSGRQRRYAPKPRPEMTEEQYLRYLESGENPPTNEEQNIAIRGPLNIAVGIPKSATGLLQVAGAGYAAGKAGLQTYFGDKEQQEQGFGENFAENLYGKQGMAEAAQWVQDETLNHLARIPPHLRNETNRKRIEATLTGSKTRRDILLKYANPLYRAGQEADKWINSTVGLRDPQEETTADELLQIAGGSLIPSNWFAKPAVSVANAGARALTVKALKRAAELTLPGNTGTVKSAATNIAVQSALNQVMRAMTDQPSVRTGDAMLAEEIAASGELTTDAGHSVVQTPSGRLTTPPTPEKDKEQGLGGWKKAALVGGGAAILISALRGKATAGLTKNIVDDTIHGANAVPTKLVPTNKTMLRPALSAGQVRYSDYVNRVKPLKDVAEKAMAGFSEADVQRKLEIIERYAHEAAPVNIFAAAARTLRYGEIPGLGRKTLPMEKVDKFLSTFKPDELTQFNEGMQLKHLNGEYAKSLQGAQDKLDLARIAHRNGTGSYGDVKKAEAAQLKMQQTSPFDGMSVQDARTKMAQFDTNAKNLQGERMFRQIASDVREAQVKRGHYTQAEMDKMIRSNPYYVPQVNDPIKGATWWRKGHSVIGDAMAGRSEARIYEKRAAVFKKGDIHEKVTTPADPFDALKNAIHDFHTYDRKNEAIAQYVDIIAGTPEWGKAMRVAHPSTSMTEFNNGHVSKSVLDNNKVVVYSRNGRLHYIEMGDQEVARTLAFNPGAAMAGVDALRRFNQAFLTGPWAPWFAWKGAKYEMAPLRMLKKENETFGIISSAVKNAFPNNKLINYMNDFVPDGTAKFDMISHAFGAITHNAVDAMGRKIANDLTFQSGFFNWLAQQPGGRALLTNVGDVMVRSLNDSIYTLAHKTGILGQTYSNEATLAMIKGYDSAEAIVAAFKPAHLGLRAYRSILDCIRSSAKLAFLSSSYKRLEREYKARGQKIPQSEIDKIVHRAKVSSGDMTISPGKPGVAKAQGAVTYGKTTMNSLAALGEAAVKRPTDFGLRFLGNSVVPKLWTVSKISMAPGVAAWYWNQLNDQERAQNTPTIKPEYFIEWAESGQAEPPALKPEHMTLLPDAPETVAFTAPIMAALQALGMFGDANDVRNAQGRPTGLVNAQQYMNSADEGMVMVGDALDSLISIPTPGIFNAIFGYKSSNLLRLGTGMLNGEPIMEQVVKDDPNQSEGAKRGLGMLMGLFGQTADMMKHASGEIEPDDNWVEQAAKVFYHTGESWVKKIPENMEEFGAGTLFGTQRRAKATTGARERMVDVFHKIDKIVAQRSLERRGLTDQVLNDPKLMDMRDELISSLNRHDMQRLKKRRSEANNLLAKLEREQYKMSTANYETAYRSIQKDMQHINVLEQQALDEVTNSFMHPSRYGMSAEDAIDLLAGITPSGTGGAEEAAGAPPPPQRRY